MLAALLLVFLVVGQINAVRNGSEEVTEAAAIHTDRLPSKQRAKRNGRSGEGHRAFGLNLAILQLLGGQYFTVGTDTTYSISGSFNVTDVSTPGRVVTSVYSRDLTAAFTHADNQLSSLSTLNESFTWGGSPGDNGAQYRIVGSLNGNLIAGHEYILDWYGLFKADPDPDGGASAVGNFKFEIGVPDSCPTVLLLGAGLLGLADTTGHFRETDERRPLKSTSGPNNPRNF